MTINHVVVVLICFGHYFFYPFKGTMNERRILATTRHSDVLKYHPGIRRSEKRPCEEDKVVLLDLLVVSVQTCLCSICVAILMQSVRQSVSFVCPISQSVSQSVSTIYPSIMHCQSTRLSFSLTIF